jgi:hypothetical protein
MSIKGCKLFEFYHPEYCNDENDWKEIYAIDEDDAAEKVGEMIYDNGDARNPNDFMEYVTIKGHGKYKVEASISIDFLAYRVKELDKCPE